MVSPSSSISSATTSRRRPFYDGSSRAAGKNRKARVDAEVALALVYLQTNRYTAARGLFGGYEDAIDLPLWDLMRSWATSRLTASTGTARRKSLVPFTRETDWQLPSVVLELDGQSVEARIDTGGDLLVLSPDVATARRDLPRW